jgi:CRP-like cAMP-binding protein
MRKACAKQQLPLHDQNYLFALMPEKVKERLRPLAELVVLKRGEILMDCGKNCDYVYFPIDAIAASVFVTEVGAATEVAIIGNEGIVGALSLLSEEDTNTTSHIMSEGVAYRLPKQYVSDELHFDDNTLSLFLRYIQFLIAQTSITAACNRYHSIEQQFCKLLLLSLDRLPCNNLILTQELISSLLGVRREGICEAALKLQKLGVIEYHRGHITVLNRDKLERLSCECYKILARINKKLIPATTINIPISGVYAARPNSFFDPKCIHCFKLGSCVYLRRNIIQATKKCVSSQLQT